MKVNVWVYVNSSWLIREMELPVLPTLGMVLKLKVGQEFYYLKVDKITYIEEPSAIEVECEFEDDVVELKKQYLKLLDDVKSDQNWKFEGTPTTITIEQEIENVRKIPEKEYDA